MNDLSNHYIIITINTDRIIRDYPRQSVTDESQQNEAVEIDHNYGYMVASDGIATNGQGTANITISVKKGDTIYISGISESNNFENSIIIYGIQKNSGNDIFFTFRLTSVEGNLPVPNDDQHVLPAIFEKTILYILSTDIINKGEENISVKFSLYDFNNTFYGCFKWNATIRATFSC